MSIKILFGFNDLMKNRPTILFIAFLFSLLATGCATKENPDPWEPMNRGIFSFNETLDKYALKPIAKRYDEHTPEPVKKGTGNFFNNTLEPRNIFNSFLQGKFKESGQSTLRFLINTTVGLFGIMDVAGQMNLEYKEEKFGETLSVWGLPHGPYFVMPLFGPSTVADAAGFVPNYYLTPLNYINDNSVAIALFVMYGIHTRSTFLDIEQIITGDKYVFMRDAYLQRRTFRVNDGELEIDFEEDEDFFEDDI